MKKIFLSLLVMGLFVTGFAQSCWWVFLTDKSGATFDPYTYFDAKAIERYRLNHADLWDSSNYPLNGEYVKAVCALATEEVGQSRWLNAVAVTATDEQVARIARLPFVRSVRLIESELQLASCDEDTSRRLTDSVDFKAGMTVQLLRMQGELFREKGIDGRGIRIAVFDAGFLRVDSHEAFRHLRDSNRIVATWNFTRKKADVYGWSSHGTSVLSCITGVIDTIDTMQLGLATGSEFLLAKTMDENRSSHKNEVCWILAAEWADRNGADIISSSVGYGYGYYSVKQMDGSSTIAKAANMAARKGILVCQAAANLGNEDAWKTIVTPADADSVLTVGGIEGKLLFYEHSSFSSYGPTADGRLKPNVCNFADVYCASSDSTFVTFGWGTSYSTPLTAGFCACAWQLNRSLTAMQLKAEVEKSADLYPYYDYALGYGVPQASWFTEETRKGKEPTFVLKDSAQYIVFSPLRIDTTNFLFLHVRDSNGLVEKYLENSFIRDSVLADRLFPCYIRKSDVGANILCICYNGYVSEFRLHDSDIVTYGELYVANEEITVIARNYWTQVDSDEDPYWSELDDYGFYFPDLFRTLADNKVKWLENRFSSENDMAVGMMAGIGNEAGCSAWSPSFYYGNNLLMQIGRPWYKVGVGYGFSHTNFNKPAQFGIASAAENSSWYLTNLDELSLQLFQRIRLASLGRKDGLFWDLGLYGSYGWSRDKVRFKTAPEAAASKQVLIRPERLADYRWNYGVVCRFNYRLVGIYARYRVKGLLGEELRHPEAVLPRLMLGVSYILH